MDATLYSARKVVGCVSLSTDQVLGQLLGRAEDVRITLERDKRLLIRLHWQEPDGHRVVVEAHDIGLLWWKAAVRLAELEGYMQGVSSNADVQGIE